VALGDATGRLGQEVDKAKVRMSLFVTKETTE